MKELIEELKAFIEFHAELSAQIDRAFDPKEITMTVKGNDVQSLIDFYEQHHWRKVEDGLPEEGSDVEFTAGFGESRVVIGWYFEGKFKYRYCLSTEILNVENATHWRPITRPK